MSDATDTYALARNDDGTYSPVPLDDPQAVIKEPYKITDVRIVDAPVKLDRGDVLAVTVTLHTPESRALAREYLEWQEEHRPPVSSPPPARP